MPIFLRFRSYKVFFWMNENDEPIHFHVTEGNPTANATKVWILSDGSFKLANNDSRIPMYILRRIMIVMQDNLDDFKAAWQMVHGSMRYYG